MADDAMTNEIVAAAEDAKARRSAVGANPEPPESANPDKRWPIAAVGIGVGVGSAALAAALLYANRTRKR